jgi:flagellar motility protein MotE (MotC chaperone)
MASQQTKLTPPQPDYDVIAFNQDRDGTMKQSITEKQLKNLIYEVQETKRQYETKLQSLQTRDSRLQMAEDNIKKDIENLNNLRIELASMVVHLKEQRDKLLASRLEIAQAEKANLAKIATTYDKMDASSASKILTNMSVGSDTKTKISNIEVTSSGFNDAVKILYYMGERNKGKILAELAASEPKLAAALCERLKQIVEER